MREHKFASPTTKTRLINTVSALAMSRVQSVLFQILAMCRCPWFTNSDLLTDLLYKIFDASLGEADHSRYLLRCRTLEYVIKLRVFDSRQGDTE